MSTHNILFQYRKNHPNYPNLQICDLSKGLKNEFKIALVNEPSVFGAL